MDYRETYETLRDQAQATGTDQREKLRADTRMAVRVDDGTEVVTFARRGKPWTDGELDYARRKTGIPADARRMPETGQTQKTERSGHTWWLVSFTWHVEAEQQVLL
jgi:transposase